MAKDSEDLVTMATTSADLATVTQHFQIAENISLFFNSGGARGLRCSDGRFFPVLDRTLVVGSKWCASD
jgi:hypothetical protein